MQLTPEQQAEIIRRREEQGLSHRSIARVVGVSEGAVNYHLCATATEKLGQPPREVTATPERRKIIVRNGRQVVGFCRADDELLQALDAEGLTPGQIGRRMKPARKPHVIRARRATLERRDARLEAGAQLVGEA